MTRRCGFRVCIYSILKHNLSSEIYNYGYSFPFDDHGLLFQNDTPLY